MSRVCRLQRRRWQLILAVILPECKGRSLEEVNLLFYHKVSAWRSTNWQPPVNATADLAAMTDTHDKVENVEDKMANIEHVEDLV